MQIGGGGAEQGAVKAELMKESLAERLEHTATIVEREGSNLADTLRAVEGEGLSFIAGGIRKAAAGVRGLSVPDVMLRQGNGSAAMSLAPIAIGLGAGLLFGFLVRKVVR